jgi:peptide-methionine (R)-S-oxide reductase
LNGLFEEGTYVCAGCGTDLFTSTQKFDGHCGWPSFDGEIGGGERVKKIKDFSHGMVRTEIVCAKCNGHLGHIFDDGPTQSGLRYCVNGLSIGFKKKEK